MNFAKLSLLCVLSNFLSFPVFSVLITTAANGTFEAQRSVHK